MELSRRRVRIIVNPIAGKGDGPVRADAVERLLRDAGCEVERFGTRVAGDATRLSHEAAEAGVDVVLACGGDGTVNEAVQGLAGTHTALAVMPLGTANVLAHELELGRSPRKTASLVLGGRRRQLDLGRCASRYFICMASAGFDASVARRMAIERKGAITYASYVGPTWKAFVEYPFEPLRVRVDGKPLGRVPVYHLIVGNTRSYGGPFTMTPRAKPDDGFLDACAFGGRGKSWLATYMTCTVVQMHHRLANVRCLRARTFDVESDRPVPVQLDGDFLTLTPVTFEIVPGAITVLSKR